MMTEFMASIADFWKHLGSKGPWDAASQTFCSARSTLNLDYIFLGLVPSGTEHLQGQKLHNIPE